MLDLALLFVRNRLDAHLRRRLGVSDVMVVLNHLGGRDDSQVQKNQNRIIMTLVALEHETNKGYHSASSHGAIRKMPPQRFNLQVLMSANFDDYAEALKILSETILFFQAAPAFQPGEHPDMPAGLTALHFEVDSSSENKASELWNMLGASYLPSILYKVRHVTLDADQISDLHAPIESHAVEVGA